MNTKKKTGNIINPEKANDCKYQQHAKIKYLILIQNTYSIPNKEEIY